MVQLIQSLLTLTRQQAALLQQGLAFTDAFSGALTRAAGENVGTYNILQTGLLLRMVLRCKCNYNITYNGTTFAITQRPITITVTAGQSKIYGAVDPSLLTLTRQQAALLHKG
jgi:hypothetical protein